MITHRKGTDDLGVITSGIISELGLCQKEARGHNLPQAISWIHSAKKDLAKAETLLLNMRKAEKHDALKYYHV